ncbi:MAG TPA: aspartyl/glutamyl-tRNA amidotransferase subunit C [Anaerolineaceae bacterium]
MSEPISPDVFEHLVSLAALELDPQQGEYLRRQLNNQLKSIQELEAIPIPPETPLAAHGVPYPLQISQAPRADRWAPCPDAEAILKQAPQVEDGYIIVPDIPHTELE